MDIFNERGRPMNDARHALLDKFGGNDQIKLGKTSTKRATNVGLLKDNSQLNSIFEAKIGQNKSG